MSRLIAGVDYCVCDSLTLAAEAENVEGEQDLIALVWVGRLDEERAPWRIQSSSHGKLTLRHPLLGEWRVTYPDLPELTATT